MLLPSEAGNFTVTINALPTSIKLPTTHFHLQCSDTKGNLEYNNLKSKRDSKKIGLVVGHGLSGQPGLLTHFMDSWTDLVSIGANNNTAGICSLVTYTARGHGHSSGWEQTAEIDTDQFSWRRLSHDMMNVAEYFSFDHVVASGESMGAATALYTAIHFPRKIAALILIRPPTGWQERELRRHHILAGAKRLQQKSPSGDRHHFVLVGAAHSDFPPLRDSHVYAAIRCPTLILGVKHDSVHPESSAITLHRLIAHSELHFAIGYKEALLLWPSIINDFLNRLGSRQ